MAHEIDMTTGKAAMAYVGEKPWHGLGQELKAGASIDEWITAAGMDFEVIGTPVLFTTDDDVYAFDNQKVLYRNDTLKPLSIVSEQFRIVQPKEVMEFYRELTEKSGFTMETAGVLFDGRKYWGMAKIGEDAKILDDTIKGYLLLATAVDGTMATLASYTSVRVVCNNTLAFAMQEINSKKNKMAVRVTHRSHFNVDEVKSQLGIASTSWDAFLKNVDIWSKRKVTKKESIDYLTEFANTRNQDGEIVTSPRILEKLEHLYNGGGKGSTMDAAKGTAWGLINSVTEYVDHHRGRDGDSRFDKALFGDGVGIKQKAVELANELV